MDEKDLEIVLQDHLDGYHLDDYLEDLSANVSIGSTTIASSVSANATSWQAYDMWNNNASGKITLNGPNADIEVNGQSMMGMLEQIQQRLNILRPNIELESEWDQLRELGEQYRKLEAELIEKQKAWNSLKQ